LSVGGLSVDCYRVGGLSVGGLSVGGLSDNQTGQMPKPDNANADFLFKNQGNNISQNLT
jgi:hypothetical protein